MKLHQNLQFSTISLPNFSANTVIGTAVNTVDQVSSFRINQTTSGITLTIPTPSENVDGLVCDIFNSGTVPLIFSITGINTTIEPQEFEKFIWFNNGWRTLRKKNILIPTAPTITVVSGATTITQSVYRTLINFSSVTFYVRVVCNTPTHTSIWQILAIPNITGYSAPHIEIQGTYRQTGNPASYPAAPYMGNEACVWVNNQVYIGAYSENTATIRHINLAITYSRN